MDCLAASNKALEISAYSCRQAAVELCDLTIIDSEELIQASHHSEFTILPFTAFFSMNVKIESFAGLCIT